MDEKNSKGGNVLPFKRDAKPAAAAVSTVAFELRELLAMYDQLIGLLREAYAEELDVLTDDLVMLAVRCREALASGSDEKAGQDLLKEMRRELRQFPQNLRSLLPGIGPRLGESIQQKLGIQFSRY